ncbi:hypothetical protein PGH47_22030 [Streptomyces sp. HUAS 31]|uniref:hypothetical protein n=1 Tax=Streptomyces sp. HUAS 31 TaxID=3020055 RepID=UPI0023057653|nr:hypothetical protein [Streptomyces sp. HUAS 31]WCD98197.1 hypothetical protein PGH47_22030 [Streptomyces sp. HUAS 31]
MPGTVLLLAASPAGKGCLVDAASVLPVLAAVPPPVLSGTDTANVVELADPLEPQAVLTRLRAAATAPGPLTVFVAGQLQLDRRQHLPHLALARSTPATVRYTGFPWHWFREELRLRPPGSTSLVADLHADAETWEWLLANPLDSGRTSAVYGRVAPPPNRRTVAGPAYMKAVATLLRSGHRPPLDQLHQQALARIAPEAGVGTDIVLTAQAPAQAPVPAYIPSPPPSPAPIAQALVPTAQAPVRTAPPAPLPSPEPARATTAPPTLVLTPVPGPPPRPAHSPVPVDPHAAITAAVQSGQHGDADALAALEEHGAMRAHGPASPEALHWSEVRADLAMLAGDPARSCRTWLTVASARLGAGQTPDTPAVEAAVDRAHHQWGEIRDAMLARELGAALAELRSRVPGRRRGALANVHQRLKELQVSG